MPVGTARSARESSRERSRATEGIRTTQYSGLPVEPEVMEHKPLIEPRQHDGRDQRVEPADVLQQHRRGVAVARQLDRRLEADMEARARMALDIGGDQHG